MSNVLIFPRARTQSGDRQAIEKSPSEKRSEILLFTGVRYERHPDEGPQNAAPETFGRDNTQSPRRRKARRRA
jgi:hypothetical protein